jgi:glutamate-1-semialdehyde 2,1-aminomutase
LAEKTLERHGDEVAAVITEPCMCNTGCIEPRAGYLEGLRRLCDQHGSLLIFDEVITGFRLALGGAQEFYSVVPDLAVFGKAVAGGFPVSVIAGRQPYIDYLAEGRTIHAGTLNGNPVGVAACMASLRLLEQDGGAAYKRLYELGGRLIRGLRERAAEHGVAVLVQGPGPAFHLGFTNETAVHDYRDAARAYDVKAYARFAARMRERGVLLIGRGIWYLSTVHSEADVDAAIRAADEVFQGLGSE